jgi:hypothetical protein
MTRLTARSSMIFIATANHTRVYRSVSEIPLALRHKLNQSTRSMNSATILIADRRGQQELIRALEGGASDVQCRFFSNIHSPSTQTPEPLPAPRRRPVFAWRRWLELLLPAALGASLWFFIDSHF